MLSTPRTIGLVATLLAGTFLFAVVVDGHYAIHTWLFWRYVGYWLSALVWAASCAALGHRVLGVLFPRRLPILEQLTFGFAIGVLAFALSIFFLGLARGLGTTTFFALPLAFLAIGSSRLARDIHTALRSFDTRRASSVEARHLPLLALGFVGVGLLYFQLLSPEPFSYDARWYHIPIAQRYALSGAIARFDEGYWFAAYPLLTTYLDTWAFLAPKILLFDRLELCAHIEFILFLATLAQIPLLVRRLVPGTRTSLSWVAMFLFPQIYLYDSNLSGDADHVAAFFAIPMVLSFWRAWRDLRARNVLLFALLISGAALTKYTALSIILPLAVALFARGLWLSVRDGRIARWQALALLVAAPIVFTAPHWLKNWIWFGDPLFPVLRKYLTVHPWNPDAELHIKALEKIVQHAPRNLMGLRDALAATVTFSFVVHDWHVLHHEVPIFGSLFTLTLPCLFFIRGARRIVWLYAASMSAVFVWYLLILQERYLQAVLPWMAAATAACLLRIWQSGWLARIALSPLIALQLIWGGDVPFFRTHNEILDSPIRRVAQFLASGFEKTPRRFDVFEPLTTIGRLLPPDAVVVAHDQNRTLGIDRRWVADVCQTRIGYRILRTPAAIHRELTSLGVTHLVWVNRSPEVDSFASELSFLNYAINHTQDQVDVGGGYTVARLPREPPSGGETDFKVALFGCGNPYRTGWYRLTQLSLPAGETRAAPAPDRELEDLAVALDRADMVVVDTSCNPDVHPPASFVLGTEEGRSLLYVRRVSSHAN